MLASQLSYEESSVALQKARENLNKALELDPDLPDAHYLNGYIAFVSEWDWEKAEREFLKALAINPNDAQSRIQYAHLLCVLQRKDEAETQANLAITLDPLNPEVQILYSTSQYFINGCDGGRTELDKLLNADPNNFGANTILNYLAFYCKDYKTVMRTEKIILQEYMQEEFDNDTWKEIESVYNAKGFAAAYQLIVPFYEHIFSPNSIPMELAIAYMKANRYDKVIDMVEKGFEIGDHTMPYITTAYDFKPLYDNPRFIEILEKMNLPIPTN